MTSTTTLLLLASPLLLFALWHLTSTLSPLPPPTLRNKRIILLIAHPDDESMFFSPTLQSLTHPSLQNHLKVLCLSTGNSDGLGPTRVKELEAAALTLGVRKREDIFVLDDEKRFKDGMKEQWSEKEIARVLASAFAPQLNSPSPSPAPPAKEEKRSSKPKSSRKSQPPSSTLTTAPAAAPTPSSPRATIDVLITFDPSGISSHPNHIALNRGAHLFLANLMRDHPGFLCPVTLYTLTTVNLLRKYAFVLDAIPTFFAGIWHTILSGFPSTTKSSGGPDAKADKVLFVSDVARYWSARRAMVEGHRSQMVWFRWGWVGIGRYMVVNDLRRERIRGAALAAGGG